MKAETKGYSEIHLIDGAEHAVSVLTDPEGYKAHVQGFLTAIKK